MQLANALIPLVGEKEPLEGALQAYGSAYSNRFRTLLTAKLGFSSLDGEED